MYNSSSGGATLSVVIKFSVLVSFIFHFIPSFICVIKTFSIWKLVSTFIVFYPECPGKFTPFYRLPVFTCVRKSPASLCIPEVAFQGCQGRQRGGATVSIAESIKGRAPSSFLSRLPVR